MTEEDILQMIEAETRKRTDRVRQFLIEHRRLDLVADLDSKLRDIALGIEGARATWHAMSAAQRRVLEMLGEGMCLCRVIGSRTRYDAIGRRVDQDSDFNICSLATARAMASRGVIEVAGVAFDPEAKFVLTERGMFVLEHGPVRPTP